MCLIVFDWQPDQPRWLSLSANRDEFFERPASPLQPWQDQPHILAGRDLLQGGSWLGASARLRIAAVTNVRRGIPVTDKRSRGELVSAFLNSDLTPEDFCQQLLPQARDYGPFNLLVATPESLWFLSNSPTLQAFAVPAGRHVLSNASLNTPWPKAQLALQQLQRWLENEPNNIEHLSQLLDRTSPWPDAELPDTQVPLEWERLLSAQRIHSEHYGSRCSSGLIARQQDLQLMEISWQADGQIEGVSHWQIQQGQITPVPGWPGAGQATSR
ncbi:NRDE family protein [Oceanobacter mangrovi]|uniref:NRDE family protein n=1 Tax=Oceanobacter mangrovi TaxID=2862510 RepID=UPI001C8EF50B|nr:NRDE family protein [Oceanobacter mangrovi]